METKVKSPDKINPLGLNSILHFGKHRDQTISEILDEDPSYINWLAEKDFQFTQDVWEAMIDDSIAEAGADAYRFFDLGDLG